CVVMLEDANVAPPPLNYLSYLKVQTRLRAMSLIDLGVLHISVCQKTLCIDLESSTIELEDIDLKGTSSCDSLDPHDCVRDHLIGVKMKNFEANEEEMRLLKFLLHKALRLRTMSISIKARTGLAFQEYRAEVMDWVNNLSKASPYSQVVLSSSSNG
ncbi:hypothetical protein RJ639_029543, partial [Escallonia herrerae]